MKIFCVGGPLDGEVREYDEKNYPRQINVPMRDWIETYYPMKVCIWNKFKKRISVSLYVHESEHNKGTDKEKQEFLNKTLHKLSAEIMFETLKSFYYATNKEKAFLYEDLKFAYDVANGWILLSEEQLKEIPP